MKPGEIVWANLDKKRPCVILQVRDNRALLLYGKRKARPDWRHERVALPSRLYHQMRLIAPTYFYSENHAIVSEQQIEDTCGNCPPRFYEKLIDLVEEVALSSFVESRVADAPVAISATPSGDI